MSHNLADPEYRCEIGDGLVKRWSTVADTENIGRFIGTIFYQAYKSRSIQSIMRDISFLMRVDSPWMGPENVALIENTHKGGTLVACVCLCRQTWAYEDVMFNVGNPEWCVTDPAYRGRGFCRALLEMVHARSEMEGQLVQTILGIPNFYRQSGYEYGLETISRRTLDIATVVPRTIPLDSEPYRLRKASAADIPLLTHLYDIRREAHPVRAVLSHDIWQEMIDDQQDDPASRSRLSAHIIITASGAVCGYALLNTLLIRRDLSIFALETNNDTSWQSVTPSLLRAFLRYAETLTGSDTGTQPIDTLSFYLDHNHPLYPLLGPRLSPPDQYPYARYLRIPDMAAFIRQIVPALEARLARSSLADYTGELSLDFYHKGSIAITFARGYITTIEQHTTSPYLHKGGVACPEEIFWKLLFGYRSLHELRYMFADIWTTKEAEALLMILFPKCLSWIPILA